MQSSYNLCNFYVLIWCIYNLQGILYNSGSSVSQLLLLLILAISCYHYYIVNRMYETPLFLRGLNALLLLFTFYGLLHLLFGETYVVGDEDYPPYVYLKSIWSSLLPIYSFYFFTRHGYLNIHTFQRWCIVLVLVALAQYYRIQQESITKALLLGSDRTEFTNNSGYLFLSLIPSMLLFYKKPILQYIGVGICFVMIVLAMKRGVMLIASIVILLFLRDSLKGKNNTTLYLVLIAGALVLGYEFVEKMIQNSEYFGMRIQSTLDHDSSGRDELYSFFWNHFLNGENLFEQLFGLGAWGTVKIGPNFAHNDWLELLINQGFLGVCVYLFYWNRFYRTVKSKNLSKVSHMAITMIFIICFMKTLFSAGYADMTLYSNSILGFALADGFSEE